MNKLAAQLADHPALNQVTVPDLWQQQAVAALREREMWRLISAPPEAMVHP